MRDHGSVVARGAVAVVGLGGGELLIVLAVLLLLFGGTQLPKLARSIGQAQRELRAGANGPTGEDAPVP